MKIRKISKLLLLTFILALNQEMIIAQSPFSGSLFFGTNASQINGDKLAGYHKIGLTGGVGVQYHLGDMWDFGTELLYSQRGSRNALFPSKGRNFFIRMYYAELPVTISIKDWYIEEGKYYKVRAHAGVSFANIITSSTNIQEFQSVLDESKARDLSFLIGVDYMFNKRIGLNIRYTRSFFPFYADSGSTTNDLLNYFLSFRAEYKLL